MHETLKSICIPLVLSAGDILLKEWDKVSIDHYKKSEDICTNLDIKIEKILLDEIKKHFPDHNFDSEECGENSDMKSDYTWVIDPIDGTKNYIRSLPFFCITIALLYKGEPIFGIVYSPKLEELFFALKGGGAWLLSQEHGESFETERYHRIFPGKKDKLEKSQLHIEIPCNKEHSNYKKNLKHFNQLIEKTYRIRSIGSGAIALCYTANGAYDGFIDLSGSTKIYDIAAGILICKEAGLEISDIYGEKFITPKTQNLLVTNKKLQKETFALLK